MPAIETIKLRRGTAAAWTAANPVLSSGEPGLETDTDKLKIGDGVTAWNSLGYATSPASLVASSTLETAGFTAAASTTHLCDVSGGSFAATLPSAPADLTMVGLEVVNLSAAAAHTLTVQPGGSDSIVAAGAKLTLGKASDSSVTLLYRAATTTWQIVSTARRTGVGWVNVTDPQWGGADSNGDWTTAAAAAGALLALVGGGVMYFPARTYNFGVTNPAAPGVVIPADNTMLAGDGLASKLLGAAGMTANIVQDYAWGDPAKMSKQCWVDGLLVQGPGTANTYTFMAANVVSSFAAGTLVLDQMPANLKVAPVSGGAAWTAGATVSGGAPGYCFVADQQIQYTAAVVVDSTVSAGLGTALPAATYTNGVTPPAITVAAGLALPTGGGTLMVKLAGSTVPGIPAGTLGGGGFAQPYASYNASTGVLTFNAWAGPTVTTGGTTGIGYYALTGCQTWASGAWATVPTAVQVHAEVKALNGQGHTIAFQGSKARVDNKTWWSTPVGSGIAIQAAPQSTSGGGNDFYPHHGDTPGRYSYELGPNIGDVRLGRGSVSTNRHGFGGVLATGGDVYVEGYHHIAPFNADCPAVVAAGGAGSCVVNATTADTALCDPYRVDNSGRWTQPAVSSLTVNGYVWIDNGPIPPPNPTVPIVLYRSTVGGAPGKLTRGQLGSGITPANSYSYGVQNGPTGHAAGLADSGTPDSANVTVALPQSTIYTDNAFGFDLLGGTIQVTTGGGVQQVTYTQVVCSASFLIAAATVTAGQAGTLTLSSAAGFDAAGVVYVQTGAGLVEQPYTSISGNIITFDAWNGTTGTVANKEIVLSHRFAGCAGGTGTVTDKSTITQTAMTQGSIGGTAGSFDVSRTLVVPGLLGPANVAAGDVVNLPAPPALTYVARVFGAISLPAGEYTIGSPNSAGFVLTLPALPVGGTAVQPNILELASASATGLKSYIMQAGVNLVYRDVTYPAATGLASTCQGQVRQYFPDTADSVYRVSDISSPHWNIVLAPGYPFTPRARDLVVLTGSSSGTITAPLAVAAGSTATTASTVGPGAYFGVVNEGTGTATIAADAGHTIQGPTSIGPGAAATYYYDGGTVWAVTTTVPTKTYRRGYTFNIPATVAAGTLGPIFLDLGTGQTAKIVSARYICAAGTATVAVNQNGSAVSSLGALAVTTGAGNTAAGTPPTVAAGDQVTAVISSPSGCSGLAVTVFVEDTV